MAEGSGNAAQVEGYVIGGKTGTAEVEGQEKDNAIFVGFIDDPDHPYAIAVICEDAGFGSAIRTYRKAIISTRHRNRPALNLRLNKKNRNNRNLHRF